MSRGSDSGHSGVHACGSMEVRMLSLRGAGIAVAASAVLAIGVAEVALVPVGQTVAASPAFFVPALRNGSTSVLRTAAADPGLIAATAQPTGVNAAEKSTVAQLS